MRFAQKDKDKIFLALDREGYKVEDVDVLDWGITQKLVISKDGKKYYLPLVEAFYDTDENGEITKVHGVTDIRTTPWFKSL